MSDADIIRGAVLPVEQPAGRYPTVRGWVSGVDDLTGVSVRIGGKNLNLIPISSSGPANSTGWAAIPGGPLSAGDQVVELVSPQGTVLASATLSIDHFGDVSAQVLYEIDHPDEETVLFSDVIPVNGWALLNGYAPNKVEIIVDGARPVAARIRIPRADVGATFPHMPQATVCGFEGRVALSLSPGSEQRVALRLRFSHHKFGEWTSPARYCTVRNPARDSEDEELRTSLATQSRRLLTRTATIPDPRHVLVFAHSLRIGGGALWLQELLTGLVKHHGWNATVVTPLDGPLREACAELNVPVHLTRPCQPESVASYEGHVAELALLAQASGAGVALVNTLGAFSAVDATLRAKLPTAWAIHESFPISTLAYEEWPVSGISPTVLARWYELLGEADQLLFVADATKEMFEPYSAPRKTRTIRYGSPMVRFRGHTGGRVRHAAREKLGLPADSLVILNVGVMEPRKGQTGLIAALERIRPLYPRMTVAMVGYQESPYGLATAKWIRQTGAAEWVNLVPVTPDPLDWFQAADLFVNSSDIESLPRSILEAICCGLPVIASDIFGAREIITDGETGWLCEPNDVDALTVALLRALDTSAEQRQAVAAQAYCTIADWLDPTEYVAAYAELLAAMNGKTYE